MREPNRERKNDIKSINALQLNEEQKEAKRLIIENQIVIVTGRAGSGKSLVCAQAALDFLKKKQIECIYNTRAAIEVGKSLGFLPGDINGKFDPYMEALVENLAKCCSNKNEVPTLIEEGKVKAMPVQFIRGKTIDDILIVKQKCIRFLTEELPDMVTKNKIIIRDITEDNEKFVRLIKENIERECGTKETLKINKMWKKDYEKQDYRFMSRENIYKSVVKILNNKLKI